MTDLLESKKRYTIEEVYEVFMDALSDKGEIETIVKTAYQIFRKPVLVTDENYKLIFQYPDRKLGLDIWDTLHEKGTLPEDIILKYQKNFLENSNEIYDPFYADWGDVEEFPRIFAEIYTKSHRVMGHVAIFMMGEPLHENDLAITKIFCRTLAIKMKGNIYRQHTYSNYLYELVHTKSPEQLKIMASGYLKKIITGNYCLMVTPIDDISSAKAYAHVAVNQISYTFRNVICTIYDNCIVTLFGEMSSVYHTEKEKAFLEKVTRILNNIYSVNGISNCFSSLEEINIYYPQAYYTAQLMQKGTTFYKDVTAAASIVMTLQNVPYKTFLHPVLEEMQSYDKSHNTQYFDTLRVYSLFLHDKEKTASDLGIHRNTLLYRLNKIQEIFNLPFEDSDTALYLVNSFELYQVKKMLDDRK